MTEAVVDVAARASARYLRAKARAARPRRRAAVVGSVRAGRATRARSRGRARPTLVRDAFAGFSPQLAALADRAFAEQWVDAEIRDGKRGGAYCAGVDGDVSRVMMNFDGSHDSVSTLAHELGHAYHNVALADRTPMQRRTADGARRDRVDLLRDAAVRDTPPSTTDDDAERLALLDTYLVGATQVVVDIHSRFLFETRAVPAPAAHRAVGGRAVRRRCSTRRKPPTATASIPTTATSTCGR